MYQKMKAYIQEYHMLQEQDKVIAGVSGGPDSICLLFMLLRLKKEMKIEVRAVHVHHGIREGGADADEAYVREICRKWDVDLAVFHEDVPEYARRHKLTLEEAGRDVRRQCLEKAGDAWGGAKIALAHHQDDNVETLLLNLSRGCGLKGLGGIPPAEGRYIRPLLPFRKQEIELYLKKREISYCTDETNQEEHYTRNRIRARVLPYLEKEVNDQAVRHMAQTIGEMRSLAAYVGQETERFFHLCVRKEAGGGLVIREEDYRKVPEALRSYVLHEALCRAAGKRKDIEAVHVASLQELMEKQTGKKAHLPYRLEGVRCYEGIRIRKREEEETHSYREIPPVSLRVFDRTDPDIRFPDTPYTKWFDYDIIKNTVKIRHREAGDYLTINRSGNTQKLKQYFINEKIPREERDRIWLAADGQEILWIVGLRQNQKYQITDRTKRILEIEFYGGKEDDGKDQCNDPGRGSGTEN